MVHVGTVHRLDHGGAAPKLASAVRSFLAEVDNPNTHRAYGIALRALVRELGETCPVTTLDEEPVVERISAWFARHWGSASLSTVNAWLDALRSAADRWRRQDRLTSRR